MKPTYLKYQELYEYDGCAVFVADYLNYEPLGVPNEMVTSKFYDKMAYSDRLH